VSCLSVDRGQLEFSRIASVTNVTAAQMSPQKADILLEVKRNTRQSGNGNLSADLVAGMVGQFTCPNSILAQTR
jgi:hypothetical protein